MKRMNMKNVTIIIMKKQIRYLGEINSLVSWLFNQAILKTVWGNCCKYGIVCVTISKVGK